MRTCPCKTTSFSRHPSVIHAKGHSLPVESEVESFRCVEVAAVEFQQEIHIFEERYHQVDLNAIRGEANQGLEVGEGGWRSAPTPR